MAKTKESKNGKSHLVKSAPYVVAFLSLAALVVYYALSKGVQTPQLAMKSMEKLGNDEQVKITVRPATPADYAYYLEIYPDLEGDTPPADEASWNRRELPNVVIIMQGAQSVGYTWFQNTMSSTI